MYCQKFPNNHIWYETYRTICSKDFNIAFGYPRSDTCSQCDEYQAKMKSLETEKLNLSQTDRLEYSRIDRDVYRLSIENKLHKMKAEQFYKRKREAKKESQKSKDMEAIGLDFAQNLPAPNITTL